MRKVTKYYAEISVRNGAHHTFPVADSDKMGLIKRIKDAVFNSMTRQLGNYVTFWIKDINGCDVAKGNIAISKDLNPYLRMDYLNNSASE